MADRVSASITIGGAIPAPVVPDFCDIIASEGLLAEWDGPPFTVDDLPQDEALSLMAHEVAGGCFDDLEEFCQANALPFARWSGAYSGAWGAERVVFTGTGETKAYIADEENRILVDQDTIDRLGSFDALRDHFAKADFAIPPLLAVPEGAGPRELAERRLAASGGREHHVRNVAANGVGQLHHRVERRIGTSAFNASDIGHRDAGPIGKVVSCQPCGASIER